MPTETTIPVVPVQEAPAVVPAHIAAWFDADTQGKKLAAIKKFPVLAEIFAEAQTLTKSL